MQIRYDEPTHALAMGRAGYIGSHLAEVLLERGDSVTLRDNFDPYCDPLTHQCLELQQTCIHIVAFDLFDFLVVTHNS